MITTIDNGYIVSFQREGADDKDYLAMVDYIKNKPIAPDGYEYRLRDDLTWELNEVPADINELESKI